MNYTEILEVAASLARNQIVEGRYSEQEAADYNTFLVGNSLKLKKVYEDLCKANPNTFTTEEVKQLASDNVLTGMIQELDEYASYFSGCGLPINNDDPDRYTDMFHIIRKHLTAPV